MKSIFIILFSLISLQAVIAEELADELKLKFPEGRSTGISSLNNEKCYVLIKHKDIQDDNSIIHSDFELSIFDKNRQNKSIYRYASNMTGGRGDCPYVLIDEVDHYKILNSGTGAPCFSHPERINYGGFEFIRNGNQWTLSVLDPAKQILQSCTIIK